MSFWSERQPVTEDVRVVVDAFERLQKPLDREIPARPLERQQHHVGSAVTFHGRQVGLDAEGRQVAVPPGAHRRIHVVVGVQARHVDERVVTVAGFAVGDHLGVGGIVAHPVGAVPAHLAGRIEHQDGIPVHRAHQHQIAVGATQPQDGGGEFGLGGVVGAGLHQRQVHRRQLIDGGFQNLLAVLGVLIHHADAALVALLHEVSDRGADLVVVDAPLGELHRMQRLHHGARAGEREDVRHPGFELLGQHGVVHRRAHAQQHDEYAVAIDQLVRRLDGSGHLILGVFHHETDAPAVHAAGVVHLVDAHARAVDGADPPDGRRAHQIGVAADDDLAIADAAHLPAARTRSAVAPASCRQQRYRQEPGCSHDFSSCGKTFLQRPRRLRGRRSASMIGPGARARTYRR